MLNFLQNTETVYPAEFHFVPSYPTVRWGLESLAQESCLLSRVDGRRKITKDLKPSSVWIDLKKKKNQMIVDR